MLVGQVQVVVAICGRMDGKKPWLYACASYNEAQLGSHLTTIFPAPAYQQLPIPSHDLGRSPNSKVSI
jgi:hypothetical protein